MMTNRVIDIMCMVECMKMKCVIVVEVRLVDEEYYEESESVIVWMWLFVEKEDVVLENGNEVDSVQLNEWKIMIREWNKDNIVWIVRISCSLVGNHCFFTSSIDHFLLMIWMIIMIITTTVMITQMMKNSTTIHIQLSTHNAVIQLWWIETQTK